MNTDSEAGQNFETCRHLGVAARLSYIDWKSTAMRKRYRPNPSWDTPEFWTKIGGVCLRLNARPDLFITAQFAGDPSKHGPFPNVLGGKAAVKRWLTWLNQNRTPEQTATMTTEMRQETTIVVKELQRCAALVEETMPGRPLVEGFRAPWLDIPAWLRLLVLPHDDVIASLWGVSGQLEILENPNLFNQCVAAGLPVHVVLSKEYQ